MRFNTLQSVKDFGCKIARATAGTTDDRNILDHEQAVTVTITTRNMNHACSRFAADIANGYRRLPAVGHPHLRRQQSSFFLSRRHHMNLVSQDISGECQRSVDAFRREFGVCFKEFSDRFAGSKLVENQFHHFLAFERTCTTSSRLYLSIARS